MKKALRYYPEEDLPGVAVVPDKSLAVLRKRGLQVGDTIGFDGRKWQLKTFLCSVGFYRDSVELWEVDALRS